MFLPLTETETLLNFIFIIKNQSVSWSSWISVLSLKLRMATAWRQWWTRSALLWDFTHTW